MHLGLLHKSGLLLSEMGLFIGPVSFLELPTSCHNLLAGAQMPLAGGRAEVSAQQLTTMHTWNIINRLLHDCLIRKYTGALLGSSSVFTPKKCCKPIGFPRS